MRESQPESLFNPQYSLTSNIDINDFTINTITAKIIGQEMQEIQNISKFR